MRTTLKTLLIVLCTFTVSAGMAITSSGVAAAPGAIIKVDGATTHQTIDGFGVNVNTTWWHNGDYRNSDVLKPALDMLISDLGATTFRAVVEETDWEAVNDDADPNNFNWSYFNQVFTTARFQGIWNTLRYLNQKGIRDRLVIGFMGTASKWMGTNYTISTGMEDEFVETIAAFLYYARHTAGIEFSLMSPMNEPEQVLKRWYEGPNMPDAVQVTRVLKKLAAKLDAIGMSDIRFVAPDAASQSFFQSILSEMVKEPLILSKLYRWGVHSYDKDASGYDNMIAGSASSNKSFWVTETCGIANLFGQLDDNAASHIFWDGFDSVYQHAIRHDSRWTTPPNDWCFWMKTDEGKPLLAYDKTTSRWTPRKQFYEYAQLFKYVAPGAVRIGATSGNNKLAVYAYRNPDGKVVIVGRNTAGSAVAVNGTLSSIKAPHTLDFTYTTRTQNMVKGASVAVNSSGAFSATIPSDSVFTLAGGSD
jgi:O-glycosyl hydrolase